MGNEPRIRRFLFISSPLKTQRAGLGQVKSKIRAERRYSRLVTWCYVDGSKIDFMAKKREAQVPVPTTAPQSSAWTQRAEAFASRYSLAIFLVFVAIASARIISTYTVFNHTVDE